MVLHHHSTNSAASGRELAVNKQPTPVHYELCIIPDTQTNNPHTFTENSLEARKPRMEIECCEGAGYRSQGLLDLQLAEPACTPGSCPRKSQPFLCSTSKNPGQTRFDGCTCDELVLTVAFAMLKEVFCKPGRDVSNTAMIV